MAKKKKAAYHTPAFDTYLLRVEAEKINYRQGMKKDYHKNGYYVERTLISVDVEGNIKCSGELRREVVPTDEEIAAVKAEWKEIAVPKAVLVTPQQAEDYRKLKGIDPEMWYVIREPSRKRIIMCQQRINKEDGSKYYLPFTMFDDGEWAQLEPGGRLPFWKPEKNYHMPYIMVHEGYATARFVDWLVNSDSQEAIELRRLHPWIEKLKHYEHWGVGGGAMAPHRADYDEVRDYKAKLMVYSCDNDLAGHNALQKVSQGYQGRMYGIRYDKNFKESWDMADPMPEKFFIDGVYIGPDLDALLEPATWATKLVPAADRGERGKDKAVLKSDFAEEWFHAIRPDCYINARWPNRIYYSADEFNNRVSPFAHVRHVAHLLQKDDTSKIEQLWYSPADPSGPCNNAIHGRVFNTYMKSLIEPKKGDAAPWEDYLGRVFPIESDRVEIKRWVATLISLPNVHISYGLLLCSEEQGVGKSTLGSNILAPIIGLSNVNFPSEAAIADSQFSQWKTNCRLIVCDEIYTGQSSMVYNKLKALITDKHITVNVKFQPEYKIENWTHMIASSNSMRALKLPDEDRRWFVPKVTEKKQPHSYWMEFNQWLERGGHSIIMWWAKDWLRKNTACRPGESAPHSYAKDDVVRANYSQGMQVVADWLDMNREGKPIVTTDNALVEFIKYRLWEGKNNSRLERPMTIRKLARALKWEVSSARKWVSSALPMGHFIANNRELTELTTDQLKQKNVRLLSDVNDFPL